MAVLAALSGLLFMWGFTVDDALISARIASHIAQGHGPRFNAEGATTDAVTPLGFAHLLALFAPKDPWQALGVARVLGLLAAVLSAALLGARLGSDWRQRSVLLVLGCSLPYVAWSVSGMETGLVVLLVTLGLGSGGGARFALGCAAAWRPELLPWALALTAFRVRVPKTLVASFRSLIEAWLWVLLPALIVLCVRKYLFGTWLPLSSVAKAPDFLLGAWYALSALLLTGAPLLLLGFKTWRRVGQDARAQLFALPVHALAMTLAGGDWMAYFRLLTPIIPGVVWAGARLAAKSEDRAHAARLLLVFACSGWMLTKGAEGSGIAQQRAQLIAAARPLLSGARAVATVDVGWVGAAFSGTVVDLGGVTDPLVARLPGGHTTRRIPSGFLPARGVDAIVFLIRPGADLETPWYETEFNYGVEQRLARLSTDLGFVAVDTLPLENTAYRYVVLRRSP